MAKNNGEKDKEKIRNNSFTKGLGILGFVGLVCWGAASISFICERDGLVKRVAIEADKRGNSDGATTDNEWAEVYKYLGVPYDSHNPATLSREQLERYLDRR